MKFKILATR